MHLVETIFYDEWTPFGERSLAKPFETFVPRWKDIENDPEPDLRGLLERKRKMRETPTAESNSSPCKVRVKLPNGKTVYKL